ncbi:bifunctional nitric oxide dioxygenase/dihydropteridine reductase 2 [Gracilibacillus halophilus YIM-C55.5]|uniref:Flavohemoprotein n=1 Tax=Gracilibacillus halophilus YIM-C55.5 TaxID=1308866 RepID=N4WZP8_9BACI|nr:NO-inducible flavohemoprotein [Gracilibacillus halophilus]ENH98471.1 bifunctional nitric oxide dioxygenase/dihydropteridine reductase 2 [Gracilibacillus halophilus YIM-C55.5]
MSTATELDQQTIETVKSTVPVLEKYGKDITSRFYQRLFHKHPELKNIFNQTNQRIGNQPQALANAVYAAAANIDQLETILPEVKQIAHKHRSLNIQPEHYPIVGENLLAAMQDVLGDAATDDIIDAWEKAYQQIAQVFIDVEEDMYQEVQQTEGGWVGYRDFTIVAKEKESDVITSFYLKPADGGAIPTYQPGQYITVKVDIPDLPYTCQRQYSLSCRPNQEYFRISIKREDAMGGQAAGVVSSYLHQSVEQGDIISISAPAGDFVLDHKTKPLVLISGGVGLTPLTSMLETAVHSQPDRDIYYIHAAQHERVHGLKKQVAEISEKHPQVRSYVVYERPEDTNQCDKTGYVTLEWLQSILPTKEASFYFCGPQPFMKAINQALATWDVNPDDIHYEFFGPKGSLD